MHLCAPNFCPYFGEATASLQRMYSVLLAHWAYTGHILSVCIVYMLKSEELGHILVVFGKFGKRMSIGKA